MSIGNSIYRGAILLSLLGLWATNSFGGSHSMIYSMKSSQGNNVFISQMVEGEYGVYKRFASKGDKDTPISGNFKGFGIRNILGIEMIKFIQLSLSHTYLNMRSKADSLENLSGSRLSAEMRMVFSAPIGNFEAGGGFAGSTMSYQDREAKSDFVGTGYYYLLGLNHYITHQVSTFFHAKLFKENLIRHGGANTIGNIKTKTRNLGLGISIWL